jgi:hypothetical protein
MRYFIEISEANGRYQGSIHQGSPAIARALPQLELHPDIEIDIGQRSRLGTIVEAFTDTKSPDLAFVYEERSQLLLGQHLYRQLFGDTPPAQFQRGQDDRVDLRIVTGDEYIARLPWTLLAHRGLFLSATGWSVSLAQTNQVQACILPHGPKILVVAPEPASLPRTRAQSHLESLENRLSMFDNHMTIGSHIQVVDTWDDFRQQLRSFKPDIVYYYGHGKGDRQRSLLVFATSVPGQSIDKPIVDFAQCLRELDEPPKIVYLNCCSGDAGGFLGAGWQLGSFIPAVITNRTVAYVDAAQAQALAFWQSVLIDSQPPHSAMAEMCSKLVDLDLSFSDARWMTPIIYSHYDEWKSTPPRRIDPLEHDPHWHLKLDRVAQFAIVVFQTREMLRERRPHTLAYTWYGQEGQGIEIFHKRLRVELQQDLAADTHFVEVQPEWPMDYHDPNRSFSDMLCEVFDVRSLQDIPRGIRAYTRGATGRKALVYVRHQPVRSKNIMNPHLLKTYLEWWDRTFVPLLGESYYALLTVSFEVDNPAKFRRAVLDQERLYDLELDNTTYRLLDEMERVGLKDLFDFLQTHKIRLPPARKDRILQDILEQTNGHYEQTISALRRLVERALGAPEEQDIAVGGAEEGFDY